MTELRATSRGQPGWGGTWQLETYRVGESIGHKGPKAASGSILYPDLLTSASAERYLEVSFVGSHNGRPFPSLCVSVSFPSTPTACSTPAISDDIWENRRSRGLTCNVFRRWLTFKRMGAALKISPKVAGSWETVMTCVICVQGNKLGWLRFWLNWPAVLFAFMQTYYSQKIEFLGNGRMLVGERGKRPPWAGVSEPLSFPSYSLDLEC